MSTLESKSSAQIEQPIEHNDINQLSQIETGEPSLYKLRALKAEIDSRESQFVSIKASLDGLIEETRKIIGETTEDTHMNPSRKAHSLSEKLAKIITEMEKTDS